VSVRVYLPATLSLLREWHDAGEVPAGADRLVPEGDGEDHEYAALMGAADASTALLGGAGRRVVVVGETTGGDGSGPVSMRHVVAVHADVTDRPAGADPDEDLGWWATQEIPDLLA
jgi:hypothetical protein